MCYTSSAYIWKVECNTISAALLVQHYYMYAYLANLHPRIAKFPPERSQDLIFIPWSNVERFNLPSQPSEQCAIHRIVFAIDSEQMIARSSSSNCDCPRRRRCGSSARFWLLNFVGASSVNDASFCVER
jgi:hypothetical protein